MTRLRQQAFGTQAPFAYADEVRSTVAKALALDSTLAEAHAAQGFARRFYDWDWDGAERSFKRAIELNPNLALAHTEYEFLLLSLGRFDEGIAEAQKATAIDPRAGLSWMNEARAFLLCGRFAEAEERFTRALELAPD